jgi:HK97 family phage major capsid protein
MRTQIPGILRAVAAMPWAIQAEKLDVILEVLALRAAGHGPPAGFQAATARKPVAVAGGRIAVLPIHGTIYQRQSMVENASGGTSTEMLGAQLDACLDDPRVTAIVLDIDSPGGAVSGVPEMAAKIFAARGKKPIVAVSTGLNCSAAYWISSAADEMVACPSADIGSIGVFAIHMDTSAADAEDGLKFTVIKAGKYKAEGLPFEPLSEEAKAAKQVHVNDLYAMFVNDVAKQRGVKPAAIRGGYGQGRDLPAAAALEAGLVDRIATLDDVLAELGAPRGASIVRSSARGSQLKPDAAAAVPVNDPSRDPSGDPPANEDDDTYTMGPCPECDAMMDPNGVCPACGYVDPDGPSAPDDDDDEPADLAPDGATSDGMGGASAVASDHSPDHQAPKAEETTVPDKPTAPSNGAATATADDFDNMLALAENHGYTVAQARAWRTAGKTVAQVKDEILANIKVGARPLVRDMKDREAERGFKTFGEQLVAIVQAGKPGGRRDPRLNAINQDQMRLLAGEASGMNETVGSEGGFFIQPELLAGVTDPVYTDDPILSRVTRVPIGAMSNAVKYNVVDETSRATGSRWGGIQMFWEGEADTAAASKPKLRQMMLDLKKLIGIAYLTDELTQDAPAAEALLTRAFQAELKFMLAAAFFNGPGGGQPQGILNSGALVTQAIEGSQTIANTPSYIGLNVSKMLSHVPASLWGELIWLYNQEFLPYLIMASLNSGNGAVPIFMSIGGLANKPNDMILGRSAYPSEMCAAVGTPGDILAIVPSQYHMADKGGPQQAMSMHVRFLYDENTLRIIYRADGAPVWKTSVTPYKGALQRSPFVALNTRS